MLHLHRIGDLDQLRGRPYRPPEHLLDEAEEAEARGEPWQILEAQPDGAEEPLWICVFPEREASDALYRFGELHEGRWDAEREVFLAEDGTCFDLQGRAIPLAALEEEGEEEDAEWEEDIARKKGTGPSPEEDLPL